MLKLSAVTRNTIRSHGKTIGLASRGDLRVWSSVPIARSAIQGSICIEAVDALQCDTRIGTVMLPSNVRLAPPSTISRSREWP